MAGLDDIRQVVLALPGTEEAHGRRTHYTYFRTDARVFTSVHDNESIAKIKATRQEQAALVGEAPEVYSLGYTSSRFGWVVVDLNRVPDDELAELVTEAWRLTTGRSGEPRT